jgi:hypothetical protein
MNSISYPLSYGKVNLRWNIDLHGRAKTVKLLEEKSNESLQMPVIQ